MALVLKELYRNYFIYVEDKRDQRIEHYFLLGSPWKIISILILYLVFVKKFGPKLMENRPAFELKNVMIIYNAVQVIANLLLATWGVYLIFFKYHYDYGCILCDYSYTVKGFLEAQSSYAYLALKVLDLMDTIFFILRKRNEQATFLHVYHHIAVCFGAYICVSYVPGGHSSILGILNSYVHVIMYSYYFLTALNPNMKNSNWKKYVTQIQIIQFAILCVHYVRPIINGNCKYSFFWLMVCLIQNIFMFVLFSDFYLRAYSRKSKIN